MKEGNVSMFNADAPESPRSLTHDDGGDGDDEDDRACPIHMFE